MVYILKTERLRGTNYQVPKKGSAMLLTNGETVFVWVDYSSPGVPDGRLAAMAQLVAHDYSDDDIQLELEIISDTPSSVFLTQSLDPYKYTDDPVFRPISKVRSNTNHRIFELSSDASIAHLRNHFAS